MRLSGSTKPIIFGLTLAIGIALTLPHFAFGAARSFGGSGRFKASGIHRASGAAHSFSSGRFKAPGKHRQHFFPHRFHGFGFVGVGRVGQRPVIIQQFQPAAATDPVQPAKNGVYVQPRWVDGGYGVEVLQPGYWTYPK